MYTKLLLLLSLAQALHAADTEGDYPCTIRGFMNDLGVTPQLIKFPEKANYTKHQYPKLLNLSIDTLTTGISTVFRALDKVLAKTSDDSAVADLYKCMITAEVIAEFAQLMHRVYAEEAYNYSVDPAFQLKHGSEEDVFKQCEKAVGQKLHVIQTKIKANPAIATRLAKFRIAQSQYADLSNSRSLKKEVRALFIEADNQLRVETVRKQPGVKLASSLADHFAAKKQAKKDAQGLKVALAYLQSKGTSDLTPLLLNATPVQ